jgi:hypothetical protein
MEDLFKELIQGSGPQASEEEASGDPLSGILQGILGAAPFRARDHRRD